MKGSFFYSYFFAFFFFVFLITLFFVPFSISLEYSFPSYSSDSYQWPIPGYTKITSPFGKRNSPTAGASSFHKGVDIGAPEGTKLYAITSGTISYTGFLGGGGYTITLSCDNDRKITYCHVSPTFIVAVGDVVDKGELIANVGPMYVSGVPNNPYMDRNGRPTNGAITGCHLHLGVRFGGEYVDPMSLFH